MKRYWIRIASFVASALTSDLRNNANYKQVNSQDHQYEGSFSLTYLEAGNCRVAECRCRFTAVFNTSRADCFRNRKEMGFRAPRTTSLPMICVGEYWSFPLVPGTVPDNSSSSAIVAPSFYDIGIYLYRLMAAFHSPIAHDQPTVSTYISSGVLSLHSTLILGTILSIAFLAGSFISTNGTCRWLPCVLEPMMSSF